VRPPRPPNECTADKWRVACEELTEATVSAVRFVALGLQAPRRDTPARRLLPRVLRWISAYRVASIASRRRNRTVRAPVTGEIIGRPADAARVTIRADRIRAPGACCVAVLARRQLRSRAMDTCCHVSRRVCTFTPRCKSRRRSVQKANKASCSTDACGMCCTVVGARSDGRCASNGDRSTC